MAVKENVKAMQMVLLFEDGMDAKGDMKVTKKTYKNLALTVSQEDIWEVANALGALQTLPLVGVYQIVERELIEA
ncbi:MULTISPECIES: DUF1659 domain-containing protein [Aneurinibacillus]|jgi:hypothetical protein|uniref:DUF1659 domain-containing protein n=1 Tax=Aneurinibacillus thermoaerophilus TaxID=143495 RepID=A0A1G7XRM9_ANETH|nr:MULTISPECIES: DUF1659 domain-containing protein [Aneurinibacillus]AMA73712.1 hypothetical protein ACH33_13145 [Aneurinibacillus sp. XH2]MED0677390.1 DUF1659 domain-containing protein [Aneurinibacillus thermoaerophilus]MED0679480.1 DUF1659 domain-containing protein [Aneurinibacillus thermoaerophilus]MED0737949.1 DUF1659 domain-containing protein [Aneurinibacillus thermoaerophilus]MED0756371.1 DUF1659 domain-containing protein [Aneurinibacillus thermoaerophilus]